MRHARLEGRAAQVVARVVVSAVRVVMAAGLLIGLARMEEVEGP